ncbi:MAG: hypothetical protein AABZ47_09800, partial [Planctomycetota bacterium]
MKLHRNSSLQIGLLCVLSVFIGKATGSLTITASVAPPADTNITGNEQIAIEVFVTPNTNQLFKGGQFGVPCTITSGSTTLTVNLVGGILNPDNSVGGVPALCIPGLAPFNQPNCFVARSPLPLAAPCPSTANVPAYMGTFVYDVSDCATDSVEVHADPLGVADGVPAATDETRFRDDGPGNGNLIPIVAEVFATLVPDLGTCCDPGTICMIGGVNEYCCEQGLWGGPAGVFNTNATSCADAVSCECSNNSQCNDGLFCNGVETCNLTTGQCQPGAPLNCNDGIACTADSCNESANICAHVPNHAVCGDSLFCNGVEVCSVVSGCVPGSDPCPNQICRESDDQCLPPSCDPPSVVAQGSRHLLVTPAPAPVPVAILVTGDGNDPDISCLSMYVQTDGSLGATPFFALPAVWGGVDVHG